MSFILNKEKQTNKQMTGIFPFTNMQHSEYSTYYTVNDSIITIHLN